MKQNKFTGDRDDRRHTSMDSDENDYQGQGLPYALPKFDFDERFDSLVENEVFLGIPSQDDNQWIEDFSRGSSGIDFSSSAPDSCPIPRHNNVWSEATSSESVEMLLKSVGQEDMVLEESVVRDSNTRNELPSSDQMDTDFMHNSKIGDLKESTCGTPPAQFLQDFSHGFEPVDVCAGGVGERTTTSILVTEQNLPGDVKGDEENASKDCNVFGESIDKFQEDNIAISCLSSDPFTGSGILNVQNKVPDISSENLGLSVDTNIVGGHGASDISFVLDDGQVTRSPTEMDTSVVHSAVCVALETEVWSENAVKTTSNIEQSPMSPPQGNSGLPTEEGCKSEVFSPELAKASSDGCVVLTEGTGNEPQSESKILCGEKPCVVIKVDDGCSREQSSVASEIGNECGNEQSFAVSNNDQCIIYPELEKESVAPKVMPGRVMDGDDAVGVHGASDSSFMVDDGQATESPTQMHTSVLQSAAYVTPETESLSENADNIEQSPMLPPQDNSTLHTEEGCKSGLFSPDLTMVSIDGYAASSEGTDKQLQSESKDLCCEKSCAVIKVDDGCSTEQSSVVSEIGNACGNEQSFAASNNDQCVVTPDLEKQSAVPKVTCDEDDGVFISSNSSKDVDHVEPAEAEPAKAEPTEAEPAEAGQEPNDAKLFNVPQERSDGNVTSDLVNKNSKTHEVFIISAESTQSVDHVQPTEANSSPRPITGMSAEQDSHDGNPLNVTRERKDETLASESGNAYSERDEPSFNRVDITKSVDHLESTESSPSLKLITGMSAEPDSHDRKPLNVMQKSTDESLTSDAVNTNFKIVLPVDDGNNAGVRSSNNVTEENVGSTGGGPDFGPDTEGETGSHDEVSNFPSVPVGADTVVKSIHQNEDQISQTMSLEASISDNKEDKKDTATVEASMEDIDEKMKQGPNAIAVKSAPAFSTAETEAKDVNQSMNLVELHGGQTNVEQVMTEVVQEPCGAESVSPPAFSTAETEAKDVNQSMNLVELHGGQTNVEQVTTEVVQEPCGAESVSPPAFSTAETEAKDVNQSMNIVELHGGQTSVEPCGAESVSPPAFSTAESEAKDVNQSMNIVELHGGQTNVDQVMAEVGQEPCGAESVPLHSDSVVRERDGADSRDLMNLKEGVTKGVLTLSGEVSGSINSVVEHYIDSAPVVSASEISSNEGKEQSCMTESEDKDVPPSSDANVLVANLSSTIPSEGMKITIEKDSSEGAEGTLKEQTTFTFPAGLLPVLSGKENSPVEGSHSTYKPGQTDSKVAQGTSLGSPQMHDQRALSGGPKGTSERKTRRGSGKLAKGNPAKGNFSKEAESKIQRDVGNTLCVVLSPSATVKPMPLEAGSSAPKPTAVVAHSSHLPDLNTSTSTAVLFRQPFTDLQQVQLRAQIFVYGSLIQGAAPDEACMVSAFGTSDGGRSIWEPAWRACIQRLQKSHLSNPETPVQSRSGAKALDQVTKTGLSQRKSRVSSNGNSSSVVTPIIPLSSPLWNISTPSSDALPTNTVARSPVIDYQTLPPLHGYQTPTSRNYSGHARVSQAPFPVPWMASPQASPYNVNAHIAPPQPTEIVKLTTVKASPAPSSATMHASPITVGQNGHSGVVCSPSVLPETKKGAASYAAHSAGPKSRKRKKVSVSEDLPQIAFPAALGRTESVSVSVTPAPSVNNSAALGDLRPSSLPPGVQVENAGNFAANSQFLASASIPIPPGPGLKSSTEKAIAVVSPVSSVDHSARSHHIPEKRALSLDEVRKVDAKLQAEQASAASVDHSARSHHIPEKRAFSLDEVRKVDAKLQAEQASAHAAVVSPVVDHPASSRQITGKRALSLDEAAKIDAKLQAEQASAHAAVVSRVVDHPASSLQITTKRALSLDDVAKVEEAKLQAEQASAHAAAAVSHCENVWSQLGKQNSSNLMSDSEAKLASAAACIAAAASVAKAASAAAKVASTVALQAKLMADEVLITNRSLDSVRNTSGFANETGSATPASIVKAGEGGNGSSSIIYAAREAARRRVEAASAASKHAENLDAIVKAAELAAEAVAQAGKIVALGDPLPLSKLVEGGPAGYWKDTRTPFSMGTKSNIVTQNNKLTSVEEHPDPTVEQSERLLDSTSQAPVNSVSPDAIEKSKDLMEDQVKGKMATSAVTQGGELEGLKSPAASKTTKTVGVAPETESGLRFSTDENTAGIVKDSRISVSSLVEVFKGNGDLTGAWFSATVLSLKSGKALVSYKDLETDQGRLTEWVPLEAGTRKPPVIRLAHPMTSLAFDGNRKRRREVVKDYSWSVGDRVDAWLENCWSEGVVVEKNKKDDTTLSVHFPAQGKTLPVKAWHLRPSLIWTDGEWIESLSSEADKSSQGDTPKEKRMKLGSPTVDEDGKGKEKVTKMMDPLESRKFEESRLLPLSAKEKSFHIGSTKTDKPETLRTMRSGLQKEGPKVAFGVPKPGKKRKFMDVSKHCVSSRNTNVNANIDKEKSARHLVPEGGAYGWKYSSKVDVKEKQGAEPRTRNFKPTKPPSSFTRTFPQKDKSLIPSVSGSKEGFSTDNNRTDATSNDDSSDQNVTDFVSSSNIEGEEPISSSSRAPLPRTHRKMPPSNAKTERLMKGKPASVHGKPNKVVEKEKSVTVEKEKSVTDSSEPRRSNRKIQPTSRLLEGLQSSLIMSKTPLVSHEKSNKGQKFGAPKGMRS